MRFCPMAALFFVIALAPLASAQSDEVPMQVTDQNRTGDLPFSSSMGTSIEHVDLLTGGLHISLAVGESIPNRFDYHLNYHWDSNYFLLAMRLDGLGRPFWIWTTEKHSGWQANTAFYTESTATRIKCTDRPGNPEYLIYYNDIYWDTDGGAHSLAAQYEDGNACAGFTGNTSGPDLTGQGMWATAASFDANVLLSNGWREDPQDSNGNGGPGTPVGMGRTVCTSTGTANQTVYTCLDSNGNPQNYTVNWQNVTINTNFQDNATEIGNLQVNAISSVVLPNGQQYVFKYDDPYGEITEIDLPTGGAITYTWTNAKFTPDTRKLTRRAVASRTEWPNGVINGGVCQSGSTSCSTWQLSYSLQGGDPTYTTTVTYPTAGNPPVQNQSVFVGIDGGITDAKIYSGSAVGTPTREYRMVYATDADPTTDDLCWNPNDLPILPPRPQPVGQRLTSITTILEDGQTQAQTQFDYETFSYTYYPNHCSDHADNSVSKQYTTSRGNVTEIREYDWGVVGHGPLIRRTDKTYLHNSNSAYLTYNIVNKVLQTTVYDSTANTCQGVGQPCAKTQYEYDNYVPNVNALISTSATPDPGHDYTNYPSTFTYRGNVTRVNRWPNTAGNPLTTIYTFDDLGNIRAIQDPRTNTTSYSYLNSWVGSSCPVHSGYNDQQFLTQITDPLGRQVKRSYYQCSSLLAVHQDQNDITAGLTGTLYSYDWAGRVTQSQDTHLPSDNSWGSTSNTYNDIPPTTVSSSTRITASLNKTSIATSDGLGRVIATQLTSDPDGTTEVDTTYDALGRKATVTNPHRGTSSPTDGTTTYAYDPLNRVAAVAEPDGSQVLTTFSLNCTTVSDEAGKTRKSCSDGLGRMTGVWEDPGSSPHLNYETDYQYDVLGNLLRVDQKGGDSNPANWRTRTFTYDSLSRLLCAANPEIAIVVCPNPDNGAYTPGTIRYSYDNNGNVQTKTAAKPNQSGSATVVTSYAYDALNRLTQKSYDDGSTATVKYGYDGTSLTGCTTAPPTLADSDPIGVRTAMCDASGATSWKHDEMGRVLQEKRKIGTAPVQSLTYTYNLDGSLKTLKYPSTAIVKYTPSGAGRMLAAQDVGNSINYVQNAQYAPFGGISSMTQGASPITTTNAYNNRLQPVTLSAAAPAATILSLSYNFHLGAGDNGNVFQIVNNRDNNRTQNFLYDSLNRIQQAYSNANSGQKSWGETFSPSATSPGVPPTTPGIDAWGNLTNRSGVTGKAHTEPLACPASNKNQLTTCSLTYDAAGNLTAYGSAAYTYDGENRLLTTAGVTYTYDGDGNRVKKSSGTLYWGAGPLAESDLTASATSWKDYVFFNGKRVARRDASNSSVHYFFSNHLGSTSVTTDSTGATLEEDLDYYPYGGVASGSSSDHYLFTGKERDAESGNDYFGARYYSNTMGRFMSPDWSDANSRRLFENFPSPVPYADWDDPQTLNLYAYTRNNPLSTIDSDGHGMKCTTITSVGSDGTVHSTTQCTVTPDEDGDPCERLCQAVFHTRAAQNIWAQSSMTADRLGWATLGVAGANMGAMAIEPIANAVAAARYAQALRAFKALTKGTGAAKLLSEFFKTGELPAGLTTEVLKAYLEVAKTYVAAGMGGLGGGGVEGSAVQTQRIQQIEQFLGPR